MRKRGNAIYDILRLLVILGLSQTSSSSSSSSSSEDHRLVSREDKVSRKDQNVGSILFDSGDGSKVCWDNEKLILLASRRIFQDILPQASMIDCRNDSYIGLLMDYIDVCLEAVRQLTKGKTKHLVLKALADTMAGYLRVYILPITRKSFYAGNIPYQKAKRVFDLYDELKIFLKTSGDGWKQPTLFHPTMDVAPINIPKGKSENDCVGLILYPGFDGSITIPMPFLDDPHKPNSIALPFETENLSSLFSEKSAFILIKYYVACAKCLESRSSKMELEKFRKQFYDWIHKSVNVHLDEEKWYPAFGGIMRIVVSLERSGLSSDQKQEGGYQVLPEVFRGRDKSSGYGPRVQQTVENGGVDGFGRNEVVVIVAASALLIWLLLGISLVCYRFLTNRSHESNKDTPTAVLYENTKYPSHGNSSPSEGGIFKRLTDRWRRKDPHCNCPDDDEDDDDDDEEDEERCLGSMIYTSEDSERRIANEKRKKRTKFTSIPSHNSRDCRSFRKNCESSDFS